MSKYRKEVLAIFKQLHSTRKITFRGDKSNLDKARAKINEEFKSHKEVKNDEETRELIDVAKEVEFFYRTKVMQALKLSEGKHRLIIREDIEKLDNKEFDENAKLPQRGSRRKCKKPE